MQVVMVVLMYLNAVHGPTHNIFGSKNSSHVRTDRIGRRIVNDDAVDFDYVIPEVLTFLSGKPAHYIYSTGYMHVVLPNLVTSLPSLL